MDGNRDIEVGDILYGFCGGEFGRDSYGRKVVIAVGHDFVLVREIDSQTLHLAQDDKYSSGIRRRLAEYLTEEDYGG